MRNYKRKRGFTLIELLVVVTIIGLLASAGVVMYNSFLKKSRDERRKLDLSNIRIALEAYKSDNDSYPSRLDDLTPNYLDKIPTDPKTKDPYSYQPIPSGCDETTTVCTDYTIGALTEGGETTACSGVNLNCGTQPCNYCLGPYGEK